MSIILPILTWSGRRFAASARKNGFDSLVKPFYRTLVKEKFVDFFPLRIAQREAPSRLRERPAAFPASAAEKQV